MELLGNLKILACRGEILPAQYQREIVVDRGEGYVLGGAEKSRFGFGVAHGFDAAVPFQCVNAQDGLVKSQCHGDGHETVAPIVAVLVHEIE